MTRIRDLAPSDMNAEQARVYGDIQSKGGRLGGP